jgi:hypothetical protein
MGKVLPRSTQKVKLKCGCKKSEDGPNANLTIIILMPIAKTVPNYFFFMCSW